MARSGQYPHRVLWQQASKQTNNKYGQEVYTYSQAGGLWGRVEEIGGYQEEEGAVQNGATADIRIRNYPTVTIPDRLMYNGYTWHIDSVYRGNNELVISAHRLNREGDE